MFRNSYGKLELTLSVRSVYVYWFQFAQNCIPLSKLAVRKIANINRFNQLSNSIQHPLASHKMHNLQISNDRNCFIRTNFMILYSSSFAAFAVSFQTYFRIFCIPIDFDAFWLFCLFPFGFAFRICRVLMHSQFTWLNEFSLQTVIHSLNWSQSPKNLR